MTRLKTILQDLDMKEIKVLFYIENATRNTEMESCI